MATLSCIQDVAINAPRGIEPVVVQSRARIVLGLVEEIFVTSRRGNPSVQKGIKGKKGNRGLMKTRRYVQDYFLNVYLVDPLVLRTESPFGVNPLKAVDH